MFPEFNLPRILLAGTLAVVWTAPAAANDAGHRSLSKAIDSAIESSVQSAGLAPAPPADETVLMRRLYLDLLGRIPTAAETIRYLENSRVDKHHQLIDELLLHEEMPVYWRSVFDQWLTGDIGDREFGRKGFLTYLEEAIRTNEPWNEMARDMLIPNLADERERGAAYFLATRLRGGDNATKVDRMTSGVASRFFGVQLQCAKCHDHPFVDQWKQDHYYGLAAFLGRTQEARIGNTPIVKERAEGDVTFTTSEQEKKTARVMFLDGRVFEDPHQPEDRDKWYTKGRDGLPDVPFFSRHAILADYALTADSPFFKRAIVNRLWKQFMGRGLVEPVDQMHEANPASHPKLLNHLADDFAAHDFNLRRLMSAILHSEAYSRSTRWRGGGERPKDALYAVAILKPLSPDQLATSVGVATAHFELARKKYEREKQKRKIDSVTPAIARAAYADERDVRAFAARFQTAGGSFEANAGQALFLSYNSLLQKQLQPQRGNLVERLVAQSENVAAALEAFLAVFSRPPTQDESNRVAEFLAADKAEREDRCRELVWALLCSSEFRFNH